MRRIESEMKQAAEWARRRGVPLVCNEFGVYREYADPQDRAAWLHDVRTALEHNGIGWAMWDYSGSFGVVTKKDGKTVADEGVLQGAGDEVRSSDRRRRLARFSPRWFSPRFSPAMIVWPRRAPRLFPWSRADSRRERSGSAGRECAC
jgi:hypothetical protein